MLFFFFLGLSLLTLPLSFHMTFTPSSPLMSLLIESTELSLLITSTGCCARPFIIKVEGILCTPSAKWDESQLLSVNRLNLLFLSYLNFASPGTRDYLSNDDSF